MDYQRPVEALIPGVQGRILAVLSRVSTDLTMRTVAQLAAVSPQQASVVIGRLVDLGVVVRRDVPPASLVRLDPENLAAQAVMAIAGLRQAGIDHTRRLAADITLRRPAWWSSGRASFSKGPRNLCCISTAPSKG